MGNACIECAADDDAAPDFEFNDGQPVLGFSTDQDDEDDDDIVAPHLLTRVHSNPIATGGKKESASKASKVRRVRSQGPVRGRVVDVEGQDASIKVKVRALPGVDEESVDEGKTIRVSGVQVRPEVNGDYVEQAGMYNGCPIFCKQFITDSPARAPRTKMLWLVRSKDKNWCVCPDKAKNQNNGRGFLSSFTAGLAMPDLETRWWGYSRAGSTTTKGQWVRQEVQVEVVTGLQAQKLSDVPE
jgi:hypothetical protein